MSSSESRVEPRPAGPGAEDPGREADDDASPGRAERWGLIALVGFGVLLRLAHYASNRSLWLDEALLARNICGRGLLDLARPLDLNQGSPVAYLWAVKACVLVGGCNEYALRFVSMVAGLVALPLTNLVARRLLGPRAALLATAISAVAPGFVYYSSECKQYMLDATIALAIAYVALLFAASPRSTDRGLALAAVGAVAVWASHPAVFVLAAAAPWLLVATPVRTDGRVRLWAGVVALAWGASFAANYVLVLRPLAANPFLRDYWQFAFLRLPPRRPADLWQYLSVVIGAFETLFTSIASRDNTGARASMLAAAIGAFGGWWIWRRDRRVLLLLLIPFGCVMACAALGRYPARGRLILFCLPFFVMLLGEGFARLVGPARTRVLGLIQLAALLLFPLLAGAMSLMHPPTFEEVRSAAEHVARSWKPGDKLWVYGETDHVLRFYQEQAGLLADRDERIVGPGFDREEDLPGELDALAAEIDALAGRRLWLLISHTRTTGGKDHGTLLMSLLARRTRPRDHAEFDGASAYLFEVPAAPNPSAAPAGRPAP